MTVLTKSNQVPCRMLPPPPPPSLLDYNKKRYYRLRRFSNELKNKDLTHGLVLAM